MDSFTFLEQIKQHRLLPEDRLAEVRQRHSFLLPMHELAGRLQAEGVLSTYQCKQIAAGRAKELVLGQYRILEELGRGGFGEVYKALHTVMNRVVAIKVIAAERVADSRAREWFLREVHAGTQLHHPNIVMALDANDDAGKLYLVMEFVDGPNLHRYVQMKGPLSVPLACEMLRQSGLALQYANANGLVHRDIKPANLLIPKPVAGRETRGAITPALVKVVDFGLARLQTGNFQTLALNGEKGLMGTPDYMAPEQARDHHHADIRSDIYSLGCTFYFALSGRRPFAGANLAEIISQHMTADSDPLDSLRPDLPAGLVQVVHRMMAKAPEDRFQTPAELIAAVEPMCTTRAANLEPIDMSEPETRIVAHLAFAENAPEGIATAAVAARPETASRVLEIEEVDASTADSQATIGPLAAEESVAEAAHETAETVLSGKPVAIPQEVRILWEEWTAVVESLAMGKRRLGVNDATYRQLHRSLLARLQAVEEVSPDCRVMHQRMETLVAPWLSLAAFAATDPLVVESLWARCRDLEKHLVPWRRSFGLVRWIAVLSVIAIAGAAAWQLSKMLGPTFDARWTWQGTWRWVLQNPLPSLAIFSPIVVLVTALFVTRSRRIL